MSDLIVLVTVPRSGSTNFQRILQSFSNVETFGEAFSPKGGMENYRVAEMAAFLGVRDVDDVPQMRKDLGEARRRNPVDACRDFIRFSKARGAGLACFKHMPGHLSAPQLHAIAQELRPSFVFLFRAPIDAFISLEKAKLAGRYRRVDTTDIYPEIDAAEFLKWKWKQQRHYKMASYICRKSALPVQHFQFGEMFSGSEDSCEVVRKKMLAIGVDVGSSDPDFSSFMSIQDRNAERTRKVANWEAFLGALGDGGATRETLEEFGDISDTDLSLVVQARAERFLSYERKRQLSSVVWSIRNRVFKTSEPRP